MILESTMKIRESTIHGAQATGVAAGVILKLMNAPTWAYVVALAFFALCWVTARAVESAELMP